MAVVLVLRNSAKQVLVSFFLLVKDKYKEEYVAGVSTRDLIAFLNGKTIPDKTLIKQRSSAQKRKKRLPQRCY